MNNQFPQYLSSRPSGIDLYEGKSQERLANAIKDHIVGIDNSTKEGGQPVIPRIIGLEGSWGCGKSNVVKNMEGMMSNDYIFFTYDAWGNQEDLQRRSVLEHLTERLINEGGAIKEETRIKVLREDGDKKYNLEDINCTWKERLETLSARKSQTRNFTTPEINEDSKIFVLLLLITGLIPGITNAMKFAIEGVDFVDYLFPAICFSTIVLIWLWFFFIRLKKKEAKHCSLPDKERVARMWKFYQSNSNSETTSFTISQNEPTEREFRGWMQDLNDSLISKRLVIVFDNMDRLSAEKVKKLWSSIHTFFAEGGYSKIWCIVPYDKKHLANAYGKENGKAEEATTLCKAFVAKTFPVVFRVPEAVITDYRGVFEKFAEEAFGTLLTSDELDFVNRVYRSQYANPNARHIISFLNELVTLYKQWHGIIEVRNMVLYIINKDKIDNSAIISGGYIEKLDKYYSDDEKTKTAISALYYGVSLNIAKQLPLKLYLGNVLGVQKINEDINQVAANNVNFYTILDEEIHDMDCKEKLLTAIDTLSRIKEKNPLLEKDWNYLAEQYMNEDVYPLKSQNEFKELAIHSSKENAQRLLSVYLDRVNKESNTLHGNEIHSYYSFVSDIAKNKLSGVECKIPDTSVSAEHFVEYLRVTKGKYKQFPVHCIPEELTQYAITQIDASIDISQDLSYIAKDESYSFEDIYNHAIDIIQSNETTVDKYDALFNYSRVTCGTRLIDTENSADDHLNNILANMSSTPTSYQCFAEIYLLLSLHGKSLNQPDENTLDKIGKCIWNYVTIDDLFKKMLSLNIGCLNQIVKYIISKKIVSEELVDDVLKNLEQIRQHTGNSHVEILDYIESCNYKTLGYADNSVECNESILSREWVEKISEVNNEFCKLLLGQLKVQMEKQPIEQFCAPNYLLNQNSYWVIVLDKIVKHGYYTSINIPDVVKSICENILLAVSEGGLGSIDAESFEDRLLKLATYEKVSTTVYAIMTNFTAGRKTMNIQKFKVLHSWFEKMAGINAGSFLNSIINPIRTEAECHNIIVSNIAFYKPLINDNIAEDSDLLAYFKKIKNNEEQVSDSFRTFVCSLDNVVVEEREQKSNTEHH